MTQEQIQEAINKTFAQAARVAELHHKFALSTAEAAELYGIAKKTLENWRSEGRGPRFYREGRIILYRRKDLDQYLEGGLVRTADQP